MQEERSSAEERELVPVAIGEEQEQIQHAHQSQQRSQQWRTHDRTGGRREVGNLHSWRDILLEVEPAAAGAARPEDNLELELDHLIVSTDHLRPLRIGE